MDLKTKVMEALRGALNADQIRLEEDDGIFGFVVSAQFARMPALDRQTLIQTALNHSPVKLTRAEKRQILAIAGLTPVEYQGLGLGENGSRR